jgi:mannose-6-phosphate isomerase-like protein (cupin superfamily)
VRLSRFATSRLTVNPNTATPNGFDIRVLLGLSAGSTAHFGLLPGKVARAFTHRTVEEICYVLSGSGETDHRSV